VFLALILTLCSQAQAGSVSLQKLGLQALHGDAPEIALEDFRGNTVKISDERGHPVVLHFWATWCASCVRELPELVTLSKSWEKMGVRFFAVSVEDKNKQRLIESFVRDLHPMPVIWLPKSSSLAEPYWAWGVPMTYFIDSQGKFVARGMGAKEWTQISGVDWSAFFRTNK
jgi:thiol-disulfide isomerase/thioredoxin